MRFRVLPTSPILYTGEEPRRIKYRWRSWARWGGCGYGSVTNLPPADKLTDGPVSPSLLRVMRQRRNPSSNRPNRLPSSYG